MAIKLQGRQTSIQIVGDGVSTAFSFDLASPPVSLVGPSPASTDVVLEGSACPPVVATLAGTTVNMEFGAPLELDKLYTVNLSLYF